MCEHYCTAKVTPRWHRWQIFSKTSVERSRIQFVICVCTWGRPLFCFLLSSFQPHWPDILLYSFGYFSVFTRWCKNSSIYNNLQCLPPVSQLLEILGLSELTVIAHLPQTRSLTHTQALKKSNNGEKQVYDNILPSTNPLVLGSAGLGPNHSILMYSMKLSVVSPPSYSPPTLALWLEGQGNRQLLLRAPTCGISALREGRTLQYLTLMSQALLVLLVSSWDIYGFCWLHHLQTWRSLHGYI